MSLAVTLAMFILPVAHAAEDVRTSNVALQAGSATVKAELFERQSSGEKPAIIVLHGAGGTLLDGPEMRRVARHLAEAGNAVYVVHYFERTGTIFALDRAMQKNFGVWKETVRGAIAAVQTQRNSFARVGVYGYSLGGFLALAAASDNSRVGAVVEHAGGVWNNAIDRIGKLPPVLMVHGRRDARVPFDKYAEPLLPVLRRRAAKLETRFFREEGHVFTPAGMLEVRETATQFFRRHLRRD